MSHDMFLYYYFFSIERMPKNGPNTLIFLIGIHATGLSHLPLFFSSAANLLSPPSPSNSPLASLQVTTQRMAPV